MQHKVDMFYGLITFDIEEYHPMLYDVTFTRHDPKPACMSWVEQASYLSFMASRTYRTTSPGALETMTPTEALEVVFTHNIEPRRIYIVNTAQLDITW